MGVFVPEPNTIFVEEITNENIIKTLKMCNEEDYFEYLRPCELNEKNGFNIINFFIMYNKYKSSNQRRTARYGCVNSTKLFAQ